ncbi:MAG TPA: SIS domain-containing protein [Anaerolineae bacterium]|nr:SIS domain-containing protein [Anaerolineae bacterium]
MKESYLKREIYEQPAILERLLREEKGHVADIAGWLQQQHINAILIAARGTSDNAATYGKYLFGIHNQLPVALATPSLYTLYQRPPRLQNCLVLGISQSGQSPDIVAVVEEGRRQGAPTLTITNEPDSPLAQAADEVISCHAGEEHAVAATKTYTAQLAALALLSAHWAEDVERLDQLMAVPEAVARTLALNEKIWQQAERYRYMEDCVVIGRGYNYATAFEISLKLKELTYVLAEPYSSADFRHGPVALVEGGFPVLVVAPEGVVYPDVMQLVDRLQQREAELMIISNQEDGLARAQTPLPLPSDVPEWLSPLVAILPGQLLAYHLTLVKGYDPDHPRGLRKATITQ